MTRSTTVEDPDFSGEKNVNSQGRVYVGQEYAGKTISIVIDGVVEEED